jgi:hypothetical protein
VCGGGVKNRTVSWGEWECLCVVPVAGCCACVGVCREPGVCGVIYVLNVSVCVMVDVRCGVRGVCGDLGVVVCVGV